MFRFTKHISRTLTAIALMAAITGCQQDSFDAPESAQTVKAGTQLVINLAVPKSMQSAQSRSEMTPTDDECKINSLRFIAFSTNGGTEVVNRPLLIPDEMPLNPNGTAIYEIGDIRPGDYKIYLIANLDDYVSNITKEEDLKKVFIDMAGMNRLTAGNLPMVYDPANGLVNIPSDQETNPTVVTLSLKFACVKVRYNILFNKEFNQSIFGENGLVINEATADNVPVGSYLVANTTADTYTNNGIDVDGAHYSNYVEVPANADKTNADVITVSGTPAARPSTPTTKWAYQGTVYLPENYATTKQEQTTLRIKATTTDSQGNDGTVTCSYTLPLGGYDSDEDATTLPRGTYYEIIAKIVSLGDAELKASIVTKDWTLETLSADMIHTTLTLSKTEASVTSLENDFISYETDGATDPTFECVTLLPKAGGKQAAVIPQYDPANNKITFRVNPAIDITTLPADERKGDATGYIIAGNIRKMVTIHYDITPFFNITPLALKIQWNPSVADLRVKYFTYSTNLGGVDIAKLGSFTTADGSGTIYIGGASNTATYTDQVADSRIQLYCSDPSQPEGTIKVTLLGDPGSTTLHYFNAAPRKGAADSPYTRYEFRKNLQITTMPDLGGYRINFRAINDYQNYLGGTSTSRFLNGDYSKWPTEDRNSYTDNSVQSANWNDWWHAQDYNGIYNDDHNIYIYTQMGETTGTSTPSAWVFTNDYNATTNMTGDNVNPGWYYYDLSQNKQSTTVNGTTKTPEPGKTLMIFYAHKNGTMGYEPHRASHHLDPGIPLFDYEDREGYVLYDPTSEPYYRIYDDKPYIEDVVYTVYSTERITEWWHKYGVAENQVTFNNPQQWTIRGNYLSQSTTTVNGKTYYVTKIKLKAPHGDYEKAIRLSGLSEGTTPETKQYVYYCANGNNPYNPPCAYIYFSDSDRVSDWQSSPAMSFWKNENGVNWYRYEIPAHFSTGYVILKRQGNVSGSGNQTASIQLNNKSWVNYGDNPNYWEEYGNSSSSSSSQGVILFGGRSFAAQGHVGTYENGVWTAGAPR